MKLALTKGTTNRIFEIFVQDNRFADGRGLTGLAYNSSGLSCYYHRNTASAGVAVALATMTVGSFTSSGFKEVDGANLPGVYQLCLPDAAFAAGADSVVAVLRGATNMAPVLLEIQLTGLDLSDATAAGLSRLDATVSSRADGAQYTSARAAKLDNLDAAITSRATPAQILATPANLLNTDSSGRVTLAAITHTGATIPTVTNITNDVGITQVGADKAWSSATRALTDKAGFSLSAAGVQAIWDALTSALTTAGSIGKRLADSLDAAISSRLASASYTAPLSSNQTASAVLDATASNYNTVGSIGNKINTGGSGSVDVAAIADALWDEPISGHLTSGTTGAILSSVNNKVSSIGSASITVVSPLDKNANLKIVKADDYYSADSGRSFDFVNASGTWPNLAGATITFYIYPNGWKAATVLSQSGVVVTSSGANQTVRVELPASQTAKLSIDNYYHEVKAVLANGHVDTLASGRVTVS